MSRNKALISLALLSILASFPSWGQEYMFTYSKLYSQLKANYSANHDDVKVAFFFVDRKNGQLCTPKKAWMENQSHYEALKVSNQKELLVPFDANLKQANPLVFVDTPKGKDCAFSTTIMAREPLSGDVSYSQLKNLVEQMQLVLNELGGVFSSWFTPSIEGVTLEFSDPSVTKLTFSNGATRPVESGKAHVLLSDLGDKGSIEIPTATFRVLPYIPRQ
ncbi:DUF2987 domain-containing protein [Vibrio sp. S4M6]|uniref:DUF2987 domain-containing protein n=1 Tax=Vibrio sinus TaxID=2946865 RepID=UPI002029F602|nr:DUF2987 domain-containing protein [Vibrio sinus]MCL9783284.1 DUF2987 domain-containing protein [Vibrio sinus]